MSFITKGRSVAVVKEASYGANAPAFIDADYIDYTKADISAQIAKIERSLIRNSMLKSESLLGQETSSGSIAIEISPTNSGSINGDLLYENGIGKKIASSTATTATAGAVDSVTVTSTAGLSVGQVLRVNLPTGNEYVQISAINASVVSVVPSFSTAPIAGDAVQGLATYISGKPNDLVTSLAIRENLKPTSGSSIDYNYLGVMVSDVTLTYPVANIATAAFSIAGAGFYTTNPGTTPVLPCGLINPVIGKNATVKVGDTSYTAKDLSIKVGTTITDINSITTEGISNKLAVQKTITGSFKVEYTGTANFDAMVAGTKASLSMLLKSGGSSSPVIHGVIAPSIKFTNVARSEDGMIYYDTIEFEILSPDCGTVERGLSVFFV